MGAQDSTLVEMKLASNTQLEKNLQKQLEIYKEANNTKNGIKVILYFTRGELAKVQTLLRKLGMQNDGNIVLIDARRDNKISASKATA